MRKRILTEFIEQYSARHGHKPLVVDVTPEALAVLTVRGSIAATWDGVPVICSETLQSTKKPKLEHSLGIRVVSKNGDRCLEAFDINC